MERDFAAYLFTLFCPLFTSGASFSIAHKYSVRNLNGKNFATSAGSAPVRALLSAIRVLTVQHLYAYLYML